MLVQGFILQNKQVSIIGLVVINFQRLHFVGIYSQDCKMCHNHVINAVLPCFTGVCPQRPREVYVKAGEMVSLLCPQTQHRQKLMWRRHILPEGDLDLSEDMFGRTGLLVHGQSLVVLNASVSHQGNYSCSLG